VPSIVTSITQPFDHAYRRTHVGHKPHQLPDNDFLLDKPGRAFKRLLDVTGFQIGIIRKDFLLCRAVRDLTDDHRHRHAHPADAGAPSHNLWIKRNAIKFVHHQNLLRFL
jgi:hypothetical protein